MKEVQHLAAHDEIELARQRPRAQVDLPVLDVAQAASRGRSLEGGHRDVGCDEVAHVEAPAAP